MAAATDSNIISGTECTKWVKPAEFLGKIVPFASDKKEAPRRIRGHVDPPDKIFL